jgi:hypothetical protein
MRVLKLIKTEAVLVVLFASVVLFGGCGHATQASGDPDNTNSKPGLFEGLSRERSRLQFQRARY